MWLQAEQAKEASALATRDLGCHLDGRPIFAGLNFDMHRGEIVCLLGASGCGKSSLLRCLAGIRAPSRGGIETIFRSKRDVGYMEQEEHLPPWLSVEQNIMLKSRLVPAIKGSRKDLGEIVSLVELVRLTDRYPRAISGGERQRVNLARALWGNPKLLLLDEPFSRLDPDLRLRLSVQLRRWIKTRGQTALVVTHHIEEAATLADRVLWMGGAPASFEHELVIQNGERLADSHIVREIMSWARRAAGIGLERGV